MKASYIGKAIMANADAHNLTSQYQLAKYTGVMQATLSRIITISRRPDPATLCCLVKCWKSKEERTSVLRGHLMDEIVRAGLDPHQFRIEADAVEGTMQTLSDMIYQIHEASPAVASSIYAHIQATRDELVNKNRSVVYPERRSKKSKPSH